MQCTAFGCFSYYLLLLLWTNDASSGVGIDLHIGIVENARGSDPRNQTKGNPHGGNHWIGRWIGQPVLSVKGLGLELSLGRDKGVRRKGAGAVDGIRYAGFLYWIVLDSIIGVYRIGDKWKGFINRWRIVVMQGRTESVCERVETKTTEKDSARSDLESARLCTRMNERSYRVACLRAENNMIDRSVIDGI